MTGEKVRRLKQEYFMETIENGGDLLQVGKPPISSG